MNIATIGPGMRTLRKGLKSLRAQRVRRTPPNLLEIVSRRTHFARNFFKFACGIIAAFTSTAAFAQQKVDTVVTNGKVLTVDADFRVVG